MFTIDAPLAEAIRRLRNNEQELADYVDQVCDRIDEVDAEVESFLPEEGRRERLHAAADALAQRYPDPPTRPSLYGAAVGVKDIFHVDGFITRSGSAVPAAHFAGAQAACVTRLINAGALIIGKTVTTEFAYFEPGPTRNPHNLDHTPGGSSSGSAAAVAAGLCTLALGTQTIGSVIRPAAYCGVVGFKPTFDRIDTRGLIYFSRTVDHVGLFTQDVAGMQLAASVLCADWQVGDAAVERPVLGVPDGPYLAQTEAEAKAIFEKQLVRLHENGYEIKRVPTLGNIDELNQLHRRLAFAEFAREHKDVYAQFSELYRPRTAEIIESGKTVREDELDVARANTGKLKDDLQRQMEEAGIDLWVCPPAPGPAPEGIHATGDPNMNLPWTHAGMPAVTIPTGATIGGLPLGLQLVARFGQDEALLAWAAQLSRSAALAV